MTPRPCLDCGRLVPTGSRCTRCATKAQRAKRQRRPYTAAERDRRAAAVAEWRRQHGDWCPGWGRPAHPVTWPNILTADHVEAVGRGGNESGPLRVMCRRCNSARGARP
jgi:5-methylcytosine-specific restriction enzyme A